MRTDEARVTLEWLKKGLRDDPLFPREALEVLKRIDPMSTHTTATAAESLVEWWLTERELTCYERGRVVSDTTDVTLFPDPTGSYETAERAIELAWKVDPADVRTLLFRYDMHTPHFLQRETPPPHYQGGPTALGHTIEEAAIEVEKGWRVPHDAMQDRLREAVIGGELELLDPQTGLPCKPTVRGDSYGRISTAKLNAWFKLKGTPYQLEGHPTPDPADASSQISAVPSDGQDKPVAIARTPVKRKVVFERLSRKYPQLENAMKTNAPAFVDCRVPPKQAPGGKPGFYYMEDVESVCASLWSPSDSSSLGTATQAWGMKDGRRFRRK